MSCGMKEREHHQFSAVISCRLLPSAAAVVNQLAAEPAEPDEDVKPNC